MQYKLENAYAIDYETKLIGPQELNPKPICLSLANKGQGAFLIAIGDPTFNQYIRDLFTHLYSNPEEYAVVHNL